MTILVSTAATFLVAFVLHLVWWRIKVPVHQLKALLVIFGLIYVATTLASCILRPTLFAVGEAGVILGWIYFSAFYWSAAFCYVITYSAMEGDSPTLSLTRELAKRGNRGMTRGEIEVFFAQRPFIGARIAALVKDGVLIPEEGGYRLAPGSYLFFRLILCYRRVFFGRIKDGG